MSFIDVNKNAIIKYLDDCPLGYGRASVVYDGHIYIHGGQMIGTIRSNALYKINIDELTIEKLDIEGYNPPVDCHKACIVGDKMIFSMGGNGTTWYDDIRELDLKTFVMEKVHVDSLVKPAPRAGHFMVCHKNRIYIGFGWDGEKALNDIWYLDRSTKIWHKIKTDKYLSPRDSVSSNLLDDNIYIYGGGVQKNYISEMLILDTNTNDISVNMLYKDHPSGKPGCSSATDSYNIFILGETREPQNNGLLIIYDTKLDRYCYHKYPIFKNIGYGSTTHIIDNSIITINGIYNWNIQSKSGRKNAKITKVKFRCSKRERKQKKKCYNYALMNIKTDVQVNFQ